MSSFFPIFVDISKIRVLVIGGGTVAKRRIQTLMKFGANISMIAPEADNELQQLAEYGQLCWIQRKYQKGDFSDPNIGLAIVATNDRKVNQEAGEEAHTEAIPVSVADCKEESTFYFPGIAKKDDIVAGITASGQNHKEAARVTRLIQNLLEEA